MSISYKIFLTKSYEAATLIAAGLRAEKEGKPYLSVMFGGEARNFKTIPEIYRNCGYYCAIAEYEGARDVRERCDIIIC